MSSAIQLLHIGAYSAARGHDFPPHLHTCWELVYYREGRIKVPIGDEVFLTRPGLLLLTPPGIVHAERALTAYSNYFAALELPTDPLWPRVVSDDGRGSLSYIFGTLLDEFSARETGAQSDGAPTLTSLLLAQLDCYVRRSQKITPPPIGERLVRDAERIFEENVAQELSMSRVAARLGVVPSVLRAHFARYRGCSPSKSLLRVRLRQALALLQSSNLSLQEIAMRCGFHSSSHLSRHVKAVTGETPGHWRKGPKT